MSRKRSCLIRVRVALAALFCACLLAGCSVPGPFKTGAEVPPPVGCIDLRTRGGYCLQPLLDRARSLHSYVDDRTQYQQAEYWTADLQGDCEDFALWVRGQLSVAGIPSDLVYAVTETGGGHLVVSVEGWILDNRHKWVMPRDALPYRWVSLGTPAGTWLEIVNDG